MLTAFEIWKEDESSAWRTNETLAKDRHKESKVSMNIFRGNANVKTTTTILRVYEWIKNAWLELAFLIKPEPRFLSYKCALHTYWVGGRHSRLDEIRNDILNSFAAFQFGVTIDRTTWEARVFSQKENGSFYEPTNLSTRLLVSRDTFRIESDQTEDGIRTKRVWELNRVNKSVYHLWRVEYPSRSEYFELQATGRWKAAQLPDSAVKPKE